MKDLIHKLRNLNQLDLPNGATGAVWLDDVIEIVEQFYKDEDASNIKKDDVVFCPHKNKKMVVVDTDCFNKAGVSHIACDDGNQIDYYSVEDVEVLEKPTVIDHTSREESDDDYILVENGDMFEGTRLQFANCYFDNANNEQIIDWCSSNKWNLIINDEVIIA